MHEITQAPPSSKVAPMDLTALRREALEDSPAYVEMIARTLASAIVELRAGREAPGYELLAQALGDMQQFVELCRLLGTGALEREAAERFVIALRQCIGAAEALMSWPIDVAALTSHIESKVAPVLESWIGVYNELADELGAAK